MPSICTDSRKVGETAFEIAQAKYGFSVDGILCRPTLSLKLCGDVRRELHRKDLKDEQILGSLMNERKRGRVRTPR